MCGFIAQLVEHCTGIAEVMGLNPVEALIFFRLLLSNCLNWKIYCDDHISLSCPYTVTVKQALNTRAWILSGGQVNNQFLKCTASEKNCQGFRILLCLAKQIVIYIC